MGACASLLTSLRRASIYICCVLPYAGTSYFKLDITFNSHNCLCRVQEHMSQEMTKLFQSQHETAMKEQKQVLTQCIHTAMAELQPQHQPDKFKPLSAGSTSSTPTRQPGTYKLTFEQQQQAIIAQLQQGNLNAAFQRVGF